MRFFSGLALAAAAVTVAARDARHAGQFIAQRVADHSPALKVESLNDAEAAANGTGSTIIPQNANTTKFSVNGKKFPGIDFDIGESYAGLLPISNKANASELFFWFFPSANKAADDEIVIWLNGGPGCSSLIGLVEENGPFLWQPGETKPTKNTWAWNKLSNVVYIEQPVGTGFTQGSPLTFGDETEVGKQFIGFWKNFVDTFGLHGRKVFVTGESYAGYYVPYISKAMSDANNKRYYNINSQLIIDPVLTYFNLQQDIPVVPFINYFRDILLLNDTFVGSITKQWQKCGYEKFWNTVYQFPPKGKIPTPPNADDLHSECDLWGQVYEALSESNPCFNVYHIGDYCPLLPDPLSPGPAGPSRAWLDNPDVKKAIHAPAVPWSECKQGVLQVDESPAVGLGILPGLIDKLERTVIGHGLQDFLLQANGSIAMIQNMTFGGAQGFKTAPAKYADLYVPYHDDFSNALTQSGAGTLGQWNTERKLTYVQVENAGHQIPQYQPGAAFRMLEFLLGRVPNMGVKTPFTVPV